MAVETKTVIVSNNKPNCLVVETEFYKYIDAHRDDKDIDQWVVAVKQYMSEVYGYNPDMHIMHRDDIGTMKMIHNHYWAQVARK